MCPDHLHPRALTTDQNIVKLSPRVFKVQSNIAPERTRPPLPLEPGASDSKISSTWLQRIVKTRTKTCHLNSPRVITTTLFRHLSFLRLMTWVSLWKRCHGVSGAGVRVRVLRWPLYIVITREQTREETIPASEQSPQVQVALYSLYLTRAAQNCSGWAVQTSLGAWADWGMQGWWPGHGRPAQRRCQ